MIRPLPDPTEPLDEHAANDAFARIFDGDVEDAALAAFLTMLAERGETVEELTAAVRALRARMSHRIEAPDNAMDVCGTGGDGMHSLNISTAVSLVVAACGVPVAKHGNRAASSASGAADVLGALGVPELPYDRLGPCLRSVGITFLHAARHHPAMARVAPVRRTLGRRTIFNLLGPLANPAGVRQQIIGVFAPAAMPLIAGALARLGTHRAMVVHGDGFDEIAISAATEALFIEGSALSKHRIHPADAGLPLHPASALAGGDPAHNARALEALLAGSQGAYHDVVVLNAAAALAIANPALALPAAATRAAQSLASGAAADTLARWKAFQ
jgi:anthranilate phosphoribosyltransferase